jgi:uncharacterized protein (DUF1015 family)
MKIVSVKYLTDYKLIVVFEDNQERIADFERFIKSSLQPMTNQFRDIERFKKVYIEHGRLTWEDGQMDISAESIYEGDFNVE